MICRLCLNALDEQDAVLLFGGATEAAAEDEGDGASGQAMPESDLVQLISIHLYLCLSRDDAISTCICTECCSQLESFHNFWKLVELKQTTLCSQFLEIDCDVNWSEEPDEELVQLEPEFPVEFCIKTEPKAVATTVATAVNKFPCMFCEKSFKMRRYLEEHIATHTGDRPIPCPYCEMAFRCRSNMYTHVKSKHTAQWLKAREERDAAKSQNHAIHEVKTEVVEEVSVLAPLTTPAITGIPATASATSPPSMQQLPLSVIKTEPGDSINLTMAKTPPTASRASRTRSSRRKTHSPKKAQPTESSDGSGDEESPQKRLKENELILANYNAVAAAVVAAASISGTGGASSGGGGNSGTTSQTDTLQQRLCASLLQQQQLQQHINLLSAMTASTAAGGSSSTCTTTTTTTSNPYGSPPGQAEKRTPDKRRSAPTAPPIQTAIKPEAPISLICPNCGELPGLNHRCLSKPKYACDVCGKSFKMKRYLEEHFATHTGVKLHTCAFCPTEFRSKSNMYHHTKRKHKAEWERSRASRSAAKEQRLQEQIQMKIQLPSAVTQAQSGPAAV
ncbi:sal-like protein 4 [Drosophila bipectinata]|uniref:sal-like protein 4 n=1 Tax=Drosophila bipectinata TaxID=42026 RepID=UPI001C8962B7|nr:zinc finger protein 831 [Drosophila bipectinata]